jgi:hypothetical protein
VLNGLYIGKVHDVDLWLGIFDVHPDDGRDAGEAVDHDGEEGAVAQARILAHVDRIHHPGFVPASCFS